MKNTNDGKVPSAFLELPKTNCTACLGSFSFKAEEKNKKRRILGIDPGLASTGWGIVDVNGNKMVHIAHGVIETDANEKHQIRLLAIYNTILAVLRRFEPSEASMESLYFAKNVTSGLAVAEARGVVMLCLAQNTVPLAEYTPLSIKQCVVGSARAEKKHVQQYVKLLLGLPQIPKPDHAADALAVAITHFNSGTNLGNL